MPFPQAPAGAQRILGDQAGFGVVGGHVGGVLYVWPNGVVQRVHVGRGGGQWEKGTNSYHSWVSWDLWAAAESCCPTQGLPSATWLHQEITTLFSTSRYTLVLTFKPTSKMWGRMMFSGKTSSDIKYPSNVDVSLNKEKNSNNWQLHSILIHYNVSVVQLRWRLFSI